MKPDDHSNLYPPAPGLKRLTQAQVQQLDMLVDAACQLDFAQLFIVVKKGKVRLVERPVVADAKPTQRIGLRRLSWPQVEEIDRMVDQLCQLTGSSGADGRLGLLVQDGQLGTIEPPVIIEELAPI